MQTLLWVSLSSRSLVFSFQLVPDTNTSGTDAWFHLMQKCLYQIFHQLRNSANIQYSAMFYMINPSFAERLPASLELCRLLFLPQLMSCGCPQESHHPPYPEVLLTRLRWKQFPRQTAQGKCLPQPTHSAERGCSFNSELRLLVLWEKITH